MITLQRGRTLFGAMALALVIGTPGLRAQNPVNDAIVWTQLYTWNRVADFLEILRGGVAVGPAAGVEFAVTDYAQIGAYATHEKGVNFPHFFPPLWLVPYLDDGKIFVTHSGTYRTYCLGPNIRWESAGEQDVRFERHPLDVRAQAGLLLVHLHARANLVEAADFITGIFGADSLHDDRELDPNARREPARQLGRGIVNVVTGIFEVPANMVRVNEDKGGFAGATQGLFEGLWRFVNREAVGVLEIATFPMGWAPIIEPEFPFEPAKSTAWRVNPPAFRKHL